MFGGKTCYVHVEVDRASHGNNRQFVFSFRTAVLRTELFDIRFSYKCCNLTSGCLPVKMASKTVMNKVYYGQCENSELYVPLMLPAQLMHPL